MKENIREWLDGDSTSDDIELQLTEDALLEFAKQHSHTPSPELKQRVLQKIRSLNTASRNRQVLSLENLPLLDESSNWMDWEEVIKGIEPPQNFKSIYLHPLESNERRDLFIAWVREYIEEEVHHDILESFILLEGTCECHITDAEGNARVVRMSPGDYIEMGLGEKHDVIITSLEPAKAILQWRKVA